MTNKNVILILFMVFPLFLSSCLKNLAMKRITIENGAIPPDFGEKNTVLMCIITGKKSYDRYIEKHVTNEYKGQYEFVLREDIYNEKYNDIDKYRYLFDLDVITKNVNTYSGTEAYTNQIRSASYFILDRKTNDTYQSPVTSSFFSKIIQAYMINLEATRLKYKLLNEFRFFEVDDSK